LFRVDERQIASQTTPYVHNVIHLLQVPAKLNNTAKFCQPLSSSANIYQILPAFAKFYQRLPNSANTCARSSVFQVEAFELFNCYDAMML